MANSLPRGSRLGVDAGSVRIGIAASDPDGLMAFPAGTVLSGETSVDDIFAIIADRDITCVYVGSPISLSGKDTGSTRMAHSLADEIMTRAQTLHIDLDVHLIDERLSTVSAASQLRDAGRNGKTSRAIVDQAAAVVILEQALEIEKRTDSRAGIKVGE